MKKILLIVALAIVASVVVVNSLAKKPALSTLPTQQILTPAKANSTGSGTVLATAAPLTDNCNFSYTDGGETVISSYCALFDSFDNIARLKAFQYGNRNSQALIESDAVATNLSDVILRARKGGSDSVSLALNGNTAVMVAKVANQNVTVTGPGLFQVSGVGIFSGDLRTQNQGAGVIMRATDGANCYRVTVNNAGALSTAAVGCL